MLFNQEKHSKFPQLEENNNNKEEEEEEEKEGGLIDLTNKSIILITKYDFISDDKDQLNIKAKQFLKLLQKLGNGWLLVHDLYDKSKLGLIPASYVDIALNDPLEPIKLTWLYEYSKQKPLLLVLLLLLLLLLPPPPSTKQLGIEETLNEPLSPPPPPPSSSSPFIMIENNNTSKSLRFEIDQIFYNKSNKSFWYKIKYYDNLNHQIIYLGKFYKDFYQLHDGIISQYNNNNNANNINNKNTNDLSIKLPPPILRNSLYHSPNVKFDKNLIENSYKLLIRLNDYLNQLINHWPNILNECPKFHDFIYNCNNIIVNNNNNNNNNNNKGTTPTTIITNETIIKSFYPNSIMINKNIHDNSVTFSKTAPLPKLSTITTKQMSDNIRPTSINISTTKIPTTTSTTNKPVIASPTTNSNRIFRLPDQYINNSTYIDQLSKKIRDNTTINSTSTTTTTAKTNNTKNLDNLSTIVHSESDKSLFSYTSIINTYNNNSNNNNINNIDDDDDDDDIASVGLSQSSSEQANSSSNYISDDSILEIQNKEDNNNNNNDDDKLLDNFSNLLSSSSSFSFCSLLPMTNINNHERINSLLQLDSQRLDNHQRINSIQSEPEESIFDKIPQPQEHYNHNHNHNHNQHNRYCSSCTTATNHSSKMNSPSTTPLTINSHDESGRGGRGGEKGKGIEVFEKFPASSNIDKPLPLPPSLPSSSSSSSFSSSGCSTKYPMTIIPTATVKSMTINSPMNAITEHTAKTYCCNDLSLLSSPSSPSHPTTRSLSASSSSCCCRYCSSSSNASFFEISMNNIINELDEFEFAIDDDHQHHHQQQIIDKTTTLDKIEVEVYLNKIGTCGVESIDTDTDLIKFQLFKHDILSIDYLKKIISFKMYNDYELLNHFNLLLIKTDKNIFTNDNDEDNDEDEDENKLILLDDDKILTNYINQLSIIKLNLIRSRAKRETIS